MRPTIEYGHKIQEEELCCSLAVRLDQSIGVLFSEELWSQTIPELGSLWSLMSSWRFEVQPSLKTTVLGTLGSSMWHGEGYGFWR